MADRTAEDAGGKRLVMSGTNPIGSSDKGDLTNKIEEAINDIQELAPPIIELGKRIHSNGVYVSDIFFFAVLNRTLQILHSFSLLIRNQQFICSIPMLRMQIDSSLRLIAGTLVDDFNVFTRDVMAGKRIDHMKSISGDRLTDQFLQKKLSEIANIQWLEEGRRPKNGGNSFWEPSCPQAH